MHAEIMKTMGENLGETLRRWIFESLQVPNMLGDDSESAARVAERLYQKTGIRVDYSTLEGVTRSTSDLDFEELKQLRNTASQSGREETAYQIAIYEQNNPPFRIVAKPAEA